MPDLKNGSTRSSLISASIWSLVGSGGQYVVVFALLVYLARVLGPRDFGLMATVSVGLDIGTRVARWGQVEVLQQLRWRTDAARNQSFYFSLALATGFVLAFMVAANPLAAYYHSPELATMIYISAPIFLFSACGAIAEAVLRIEFKFKSLAFRSIVGTLAGAATAVLFVKLGFGALALAIQRLVQAAVSGIWVWGAISWRPALNWRMPWSRALVTEGGHVAAGTLLPVAVPRSIDLLVGVFLGPEMLGLTQVAFRINEFAGQVLLMPLVSVANTELSAKAENLTAMRRSYLRLTQVSAVLMCPMLLGLTMVAPEAVPLIFGQKWVRSVPFVEIIGLLALVSPVNYYFSAAMVPLGQSRLVLRQGLLQVVLGVALTAAAAQFSLIAIAFAHVLRGLLLAIQNIAELRRHMGLKLTELARSMAPPYLATLGMCAAIFVMRMAGAQALAPLPRLALLIGVGGASYVALLLILARMGLWPDYYSLLNMVLPRRWRRVPASA